MYVMHVTWRHFPYITLGRVFGYIHDLPSGTHITYLLLSLVVAYGGLDIMCIHMGNFTYWTSMLNYKCRTGMLCISI